jgi:hypothetical protein
VTPSLRGWEAFPRLGALTHTKITWALLLTWRGARHLWPFILFSGCPMATDLRDNSRIKRILPLLTSHLFKVFSFEFFFSFILTWTLTFLTFEGAFRFLISLSPPLLSYPLLNRHGGTILGSQPTTGCANCHTYERFAKCMVNAKEFVRIRTNHKKWVWGLSQKEPHTTS